MAVSVKEFQQRIQQRLKAVSDEYYIDTQVLVSHALGRSRAWLISHAEDVLSAEDISAIERLVDKRLSGLPVAYILGEREFWSILLKVTPDTLIPRPETELLVETALGLSLPQNAHVLDYGTGSGAIAIALASEQNGWDITAVDISVAAIEVAKENAYAQQLENIRYVQGGRLMSGLQSKYDLVVSNPPYIVENDPHLDSGDVRYEPRSALISGVDGLDCIRQMIMDAGDVLQPGGYMYTEHGYDQAEKVRNLLSEAGFMHIETKKDLAGIERITGGKWKS